MMKIPNIVHFIWLKGDLSRPFSFINYLSVRSVASIQKPDKIYLHCDHEEPDNPNWQAVLPYVEIKHVIPPDKCGSVPLRYAQYKSDVLRLEILLKHGGTYLDCDFILLKPFHDLMDGRLTMVHDGPDMHSVSNGVIICAPEQVFLADWLAAIPDELNSSIWANHAVNTPKKLLQTGDYKIRLLPSKSFIPLDFEHLYLFITPPYQIDLSSSYAVHIWETYWRDYLSEATEEYIMNRDTLFSKIAKPYLTSS
jgi:Glycosyltransferase sugar-binding region containing DXD motif